MKTITNGEATLEIKMPNIPQTLRLLGKLGLTEDGLKEGVSTYEVLADFIEIIETHVEKVTLAGKEISYEEALNQPTCMAVFGDAMNEIVSAFSGGETEPKKP